MARISPSISVEILFPLLRDGGLYVIEDAHTSYWNDWDGGHRRRGTAIELAKSLGDEGDKET